MRDSLTIKEAKWESGNKKLVVKGLGPLDARVTVTNAGDDSFIGSRRSKDEGDGEWRVRVRRGIDVPPCRVRAEANGQVAERSVKDAGSGCNNGTLPTNDAPVAVDDTAATAEGTAISIDVLANDIDADGDALSIGSATQAGNGSVAVGSGQISYTPVAGFTGGDTFSYTIDDNNGGSDSATVMVSVSAGDLPPIIGESINSTSASAGATSAEQGRRADRSQPRRTRPAGGQRSRHALRRSRLSGLQHPAALQRGACAGDRARQRLRAEDS